MEYKFNFEGKDYTVQYSAENNTRAYFVVCEPFEYMGMNCRIWGWHTYSNNCFQLFMENKTTKKSYNSTSAGKRVNAFLKQFMAFVKAKKGIKNTLIQEKLDTAIKRVEAQMLEMQKVRAKLIELGESLEDITTPLSHSSTHDIVHQLDKVYFHSGVNASYVSYWVDGLIKLHTPAKKK